MIRPIFLGVNYPCPCLWACTLHSSGNERRSGTQNSRACKSPELSVRSEDQTDIDFADSPCDRTARHRPAES
jgi:hypothetical protein